MRLPKAGRTDAAGAGVPAIPQWFREWGFIPLGIVFVVLLGLITDVGTAHGQLKTALWICGGLPGVPRKRP